MNSQRFAIISMALVLICVLAIVSAPFLLKQEEVGAVIKPEFAPQPRVRKKEPSKPLHEAIGVGENDMVQVGDVMRPKRDINFPARNETTDELINPLPYAGLAPYLEGDENLQVAGLMREVAIRNPLPQARSMYFGAEPFDLEEYTKDPQAYLDKIRPGRVFQSAQPESGVIPLQAASKTYIGVLQGDKVFLRTKANPGMPVTYHAQELGEFENRLKTITVAANDEGIAQATFLAGPGTYGIVNILAASPTHSEDVHFMVDVSLPSN